MEQRLKPIFFIFVFMVVIGLNIYLFMPFFHIFAFATIIGGSFYPLFIYFNKKNWLKKKQAAALTTFCIILTVVIPSIYLIGQLSKETLSFYQSVAHDFNKEVIREQFIGDGFVAKGVDQILSTLEINMTRDEVYNIAVQKAQGYLGGAVKLFNGFLSNTIHLIFEFILMLVAIFALFMSGDQLKEFVFKLSPLPSDQEQKILDRYNQMNYVTLVGNGIGGITQGVLAGIAFWICGIPSVFLWTTLMIILAFIPLIGMSIVFIPAGIYLFITGKTISAILLLVWCGAVSLVVENVYKPKFVGDRLSVNGILLLFYIMAGLSVFGTPGLFYGPILCIIFLTISEIFTSYYLQAD